MESLAIVFEGPGDLAVRPVALTAPTDGDVVVEIDWTGISTGTERLLFRGEMPAFPGMGYPLVPGYESVGRVVRGAGELEEGAHVFVPGARCFRELRGLFGGAARRLVVPSERVTRIDASLAEEGVLLALAATAQHALAGGPLPELIIGHGALGRLLARLTVARGGAPTVHEKDPGRRAGAHGYAVLAPEADARRDYRAIVDVSGDATILDALVGRLARGGEIVLAGFYPGRVDFAFPAAFMKEARLRVAAEWQPADLAEVLSAIVAGRLALDDLITHRERWERAPHAYETAFDDTSCSKMVLDWRDA